MNRVLSANMRETPTVSSVPFAARMQHLNLHHDISFVRELDALAIKFVADLSRGALAQAVTLKEVSVSSSNTICTYLVCSHVHFAFLVSCSPKDVFRFACYTFSATLTSPKAESSLFFIDQFEDVCVSLT